MRYLVLDSAVGADGRRVRCAACRHEWFQAPPEGDGLPEENFKDVLEKERAAEPIPESVKPVPEGSNVPALPGDAGAASIPPGAKLAGYGAAAAVFAGVLLLLVAFKAPVSKAWPPSALFYELAGTPVSVAGEGLIIDRLSAESVPDPGGLQTLKVKGSVINLKDGRVDVPGLMATLRREDGSVGESWVIRPPYDALEGEQSFNFETEYTGVPEDMVSVNLSFSAFPPKKAEKKHAPAEEAEEGGAHHPQDEDMDKATAHHEPHH